MRRVTFGTDDDVDEIRIEEDPTLPVDVLELRSPEGRVLCRIVDVDFEGEARLERVQRLAELRLDAEISARRARPIVDVVEW